MKKEQSLLRLVINREKRKGDELFLVTIGEVKTTTLRAAAIIYSTDHITAKKEVKEALVKVKDDKNNEEVDKEWLNDLLQMEMYSEEISRANYITVLG
jgi:hypothetical protein